MVKWGDLSTFYQVYPMSTRWADIVDEEVFVTVRLPDGKNTHVSMAQNSTISELNQWIEKTEGLPRQSFVLSDEGDT